MLSLVTEAARSGAEGAIRVLLGAPTPRALGQLACSAGLEVIEGRLGWTVL